MSNWTSAIEEMAVAIADCAPTEDEFRVLWDHLGTVVRYLSVHQPVMRQRLQYARTLAGLLDRVPKEEWPDLMDRIERATQGYGQSALTEYVDQQRATHSKVG